MRTSNIYINPNHPSQQSKQSIAKLANIGQTNGHVPNRPISNVCPVIRPTANGHTGNRSTSNGYRPIVPTPNVLSTDTSGDYIVSSRAVDARIANTASHRAIASPVPQSTGSPGRTSNAFTNDHRQPVTANTGAPAAAFKSFAAQYRRPILSESRHVINRTRPKPPTARVSPYRIHRSQSAATPRSINTSTAIAVTATISATTTTTSSVITISNPLRNSPTASEVSEFIRTHLPPPNDTLPLPIPLPLPDEPIPHVDEILSYHRSKMDKILDDITPSWMSSVELNDSANMSSIIFDYVKRTRKYFNNYNMEDASQHLSIARARENKQRNRIRVSCEIYIDD